ncbi:histidine phosphatase family protein [Pseudonocardia sediminis]|uniref:histidine phosphatase family protein n=1 Tax=Pseudonocardia sediminis TaxID=1397368 RepID=UPI001F5ED166|nr:histidine phosphatase family protein [Pseudonocardia sediminis]
MRIHLVCHASTDAVRAARFAADEPLDEIGARQAAEAGPDVPRHDVAFCAPSVRCRSSAEALGLTPVVDPRLTGCDYGAWAGRSLDEVAATDPEGLGEWLAEPSRAPHGGESLTDLVSRVGAWIDGPPGEGDGPAPRAVVAVVDAVVVRAAVAHALGAGPRAVWRIDVDPLSTTLLVGEPGRWSLRALQPGRG